MHAWFLVELEKQLANQMASQFDNIMVLSALNMVRGMLSPGFNVISVLFCLGP